MKFSYVLIAILSFFLVVSCQDSKKETAPKPPQTEKKEESFLPPSTGQISSVAMYLDPTYLDIPFKDTLLYYLEQPYLLTPTPSTAIDVKKYSFERVLSGKSRDANNLIVANVQEDTQITQYVRKTLGEQQIKKALTNKQIALLKTGDKTASPQQFFFLLIDGIPNLKDKKNKVRLDEYAKSIIEDATEVDNERIVAAFSQKRNGIIEQQIKKEFDVSMWIPRMYDVVEEKEDFIWLLREASSLYSNIVVYKEPRNKKVTLEQQAISMRDAFGKNITTYKENTRMTTSVKHKPFPIQRSIKIDGKNVLETRGLWGMVNDQLGGGFVNYTFENENNEAVCIDGFVFYNGDKKRKKMRDIDAILSTVQLK